MVSLIVVIILLFLQVVGTMAGVLSYVTGPPHNMSFSVYIPTDVPMKEGLPVYLRLQAPRSGYEWVAFGHGNQMKDTQAIFMYSASDERLTVSPRIGSTESEYELDTGIDMKLLSGTGIENGVMTANVRCDNCKFHKSSNGTIDDTDKNSVWIWAFREGVPLDENDPSVDLKPVQVSTTVVLDLTKVKGPDRDYPFQVYTSGAQATLIGGWSGVLSSSALSVACSALVLAFI